jgi:hypothetical protein
MVTPVFCGTCTYNVEPMTLDLNVFAEIVAVRSIAPARVYAAPESGCAVVVRSQVPFARPSVVNSSSSALGAEGWSQIASRVSPVLVTIAAMAASNVLSASLTFAPLTLESLLTCDAA